jgi:DNA-binding MarR family transcriptional regulator
MELYTKPTPLLGGTLVPEDRTDLPPTLRGSLYFLLDVTGNEVHGRVSDGLRDLGILPRHFAVLTVLDESGTMNQVDLGSTIGLNRTAMVQVCDQLEQLNLARRSVNPQNRREHLVQMTDKGRKVLTRARHVVDTVESDCSDRLDEKERRLLLALLSKVLCRDEDKPAS